MIRFSTAGESHGEALVALISGLPAGVPVDLDFVNRELWRRQQGYGRGGRMKIETDKAHILSGVRHGKTIGSPIAIEIVNRDWKNWEEKLPVETGDPAKHQAVASPRPGHADLAGALKYNFPDARYVLERASARESTAPRRRRRLRQALAAHAGHRGAQPRHPRGPRRARPPRRLGGDRRRRRQERVVLGCVDPATEARMKEEVEEVSRTGDTVGGVFEVVVHGAPAGIGTYANWDERLDGLLAWSVMSLQAVKAVEIGRGVTAAESFGSKVHDPIHYAPEDTGKPTRFTREQNNAGGIEGGVSNGEDIVVRGYLKPISTLRRPLESVRFDTREATSASYERSDICVVPAAGVAAEAMVALTVAGLVQQKFGGDSALEMKRNFDGYIEQIRRF